MRASASPGSGPVRVLGFGDNVVDRFVDRRVDYPGGNSVNVAVLARRHGLESGYLGVFADDDLGRFVREAIVAEGVEVDHCVVREGESGLSTLRVDAGERVFLGWNGGGVSLRQPLVLDDALLAYVALFGVVHSSVYSATEDQLPLLAGSGPLVTFDLSGEEEYRTAAYLDRVCPYADLVLLSCSHLDHSATRRLLEDVVQRGAGIALATRGAEGAMAYDGHHLSEVPARPMSWTGGMIDTMGCGDAFLTGFVVALLRSGWTTDARPGERAVAHALRRGADSAYAQCFVEGAFGHGRPVGHAVTSTIDPALGQTKGAVDPCQ
ncbi:PfkB family carbohydrate kinase [Streptomyces sp. NPDC051907]|uniref:PfkB family carbohydrate kinase n=1 Tax=Streptomyces sp. NPDC051907 TaxID=3155284 RepID=UPI003436B70E